MQFKKKSLKISRLSLSSVPHEWFLPEWLGNVFAIVKLSNMKRDFYVDVYTILNLI